MSNNFIKLKVCKTNEQDVFSDIIRVHENYRKDGKGQDIDGGTACIVKVIETQKSVHAILRGLGDIETDNIRIDDNLRKKLSVDSGNYYGFEFKKAGFLKTFVWAFNASDTGYKISARIALISLAIGIISILPYSPAIISAVQKGLALISSPVNRNLEESSTCEYDGQPIDRCEVSSAIIGGYTFELVRKYGSYADGSQPEDLFETHLRILSVVDTPDRGLLHKTIFELSGNKEFSPHESLAKGKEFFTIEKADDFKKLKLYNIKGIGEQIMVFQYWSGGLCCNTIHILRLDEGKFKELPESVMSQIKTSNN